MYTNIFIVFFEVQMFYSTKSVIKILMVLQNTFAQKLKMCHELLLGWLYCLLELRWFRNRAMTYYT